MKHYTFVDYATQGYIALVGLLVLLFHGGKVEYWPVILGFHVLWLGLIHWLIVSHAARPGGRFLDFLRHFYPVLLYTAFFRETGYLNQMFTEGYWDAYFIRLEASLFGGQPSLAFMEALPYVWFSEVMYMGYFSYYLMIVGVGLALYFQERARFYHFVSVVSFVFYVCYLIYIFVPVIGPRIFEGDLVEFRLPADVLPAAVSAYPEAVQSGPFHHIMRLIYDGFESTGAAFPSSHVTVALCTLCFSFRYLPRIRYLHLVAFIFLSLSTIYCRYHYVVDVLAGVVAGFGLTLAGDKLYHRFSRQVPT